MQFLKIKKQIYYVYDILGCWHNCKFSCYLAILFPDMFKSKGKESTQTEIKINSNLDSSSLNNTKNNGKTSIGRDQNNAGRDLKVDNSQKK